MGCFGGLAGALFNYINYKLSIIRIRLVAYLALNSLMGPGKEESDGRTGKMNCRSIGNWTPWFTVHGPVPAKSLACFCLWNIQYFISKLNLLTGMFTVSGIKL